MRERVIQILEDRPAQLALFRAIASSRPRWNASSSSPSSWLIAGGTRIRCEHSTTA